MHSTLRNVDITILSLIKDATCPQADILSYKIIFYHALFAHVSDHIEHVEGQITLLDIWIIFSYLLISTES